MPAARSSRLTSRQLSAAPYSTLKHAPPDDADIIILSSDDESSSHTPKNSLPKRHRSIAKQKGKAVIPASADILEISSSDEALAKTCKASMSRDSISSLRAQLKKAHDEIARLKAESHKKQAQQTRPSISLSELEELVTCEICTLKMWAPYTLPCGHTFCQPCLTDWFNTTLAQHITNNPHYNPAVVAALRATLNGPNVPAGLRRTYEAQIALLEHQHPPPSYTCPTCRTVCRTKPVEVYTLKSVVRNVADALGETSPQKRTSTPAARTRSGAVRAPEGPWDGFFPRG
ncbi:hypothetical protein IEO21_02347 [Rhodonia placenta]|uniref:RING-type domain-containing protein n=1 Tax=Rhodonia placenta TaxID=104341 RepID=A0A8H7U4G9_9APHY|nr:hypothetical protein IEO21_02347 [Postia placenta]